MIFYLFFQKSNPFLQQAPDPLFNKDGIILPIKVSNKLVKIPDPFCSEKYL